MEGNGSILVTGGTGYIGAHTCVVLMHSGYRVTILDNLSNSSRDVVHRIGCIVGRRPRFVEGDVRDKDLIGYLLREEATMAVMHFAGLKAVGESVAAPLHYYENNVFGTLSLLRAMEQASVATLVFSSSATVYGDPATVPVREDFPTGATNPYGRTKLMVEEILADFHRAHQDWRIARLRYFNPVGAHESGLIGEEPNGMPNNLMPYVAQVAEGRCDQLRVFGNDYPTKDGTGVRDYIHVMDLADGHLAALRYLQDKGGLLTVNLGTGHGYSVLEMIDAFERASGKHINYEIVDRRPGDVAACWADPSLAERLLNWRATRDVNDMCRDAWRWVRSRQA
ncbi:MAG TPA: UDP-glucose 4-epimerase GalE [Rhodocyclaceae bacterium]|nr:UDP-glucose 4-epimerase GalE [Rhodocyclaceae bacterium]